MQLRYNYRLYPTRGQRSALARAFGCARVVFNDALRLREQAHQAGLPYVTDADSSARLTAVKTTPERAWLAGVSSVVLQQSLADLNAAYRNFFASVTGKRKGPTIQPPRFKSRKDRRQTIRFTANARFRVLPGGKLRLPKIGDVPVRWSRDLPSAPSSVTVIMDAAGRYFASFVVQAEAGALPRAEPVTGIDLGLTHFAVLSDGRKIASPQFLRRAEKKLRRAQRSLSRKETGSRNRGKARIRVARGARPGGRRAARVPPPALHDADPRKPSGRRRGPGGQGTGRTRLAKSMHDAAWSAFVHMLEYKARLNSQKYHGLGQFVPTSQTCSACGVKDGPEPLHVRTWQCPSCETWLDRDINAAVNVAKAAGLAVTACGAQVRPGPRVPAQRGEAGTRPKPRRDAA